ncbi:MAG TPA: ATP-binding cassette domain-containing protein, partial [Ignavibacteriaceae bacterium]
SGKSSLLSALLGEMEKLEGNVNTYGRVAYVPQQAWIQNSTLRQNIIFTNEYNENYYKKVIKSCALEPDLKILAAGDMTEIGEKGINLSGGQKQRVSLARAVYSNADIYLLDDPLRFEMTRKLMILNLIELLFQSAVDTHVGRHLFENAIGPKGVLKDKTRILVTHRVSVLPHVDQIIVMKDGSISESGNFEELIASKGDFAEFVAEYLMEQSDNDIDKENMEIMEEIAEKVKPILERTLSKTTSQSRSVVSEVGSDGVRRRLIGRSTSVISSKDSETKLEQKKDGSKSRGKPGGKLIEAETSETGSVKFSVYKNYIRMIGLAFGIIIMFSFIASNVAQVLSGLWLSEWSNDALDPNKIYDTNLRDLRLGVYAGIGIFEALCNFLASVSVNLACVRAAKLLHNNMLNRIIRAPMSFFGIIHNYL